MEKKEVKELSLESMERLAQIMNDSPTIVKLKDTEFAITALHPGTQWLIAEEACKIQKAEKGNMVDVLKQFSLTIPSMAKIIALAILNDRDRIYSDYKRKILSEEYKAMYDTLMWQGEASEWLNLVLGILNLLSVDSFFQITNAIGVMREMALGRKKTMEEQKS